LLIIKLSKILKLFGRTLFITFEIPIITLENYNELSANDIIKYLLIVYERFNSFLNDSLKLFNTYYLICKQIEILISPVLVDITTSYNDNIIDDDEIKIYSELY